MGVKHVGRVYIRQRCQCRDGDFADEVFVLGDQVLRSNVALQLLEFGKKGRVPENRVAALSVDGGNADKGIIIGRVCRNQLIDDIGIDKRHVTQEDDRSFYGWRDLRRCRNACSDRCAQSLSEIERAASATWATIGFPSTKLVSLFISPIRRDWPAARMIAAIRGDAERRVARDLG